MRLALLKLLVCAALLASAAVGQYTTSIIAGGGPPNGVAATSIALSSSSTVAVDAAGNLYIAPPAQHRVYKLAANGTIATFAGNGTAGFSGDNGPAISAQLNFPSGIAVDSLGDLFIADKFNSRVRKVTGGVISTVAGNGEWGYSSEGQLAKGAPIGSPTAVAVDNAGNLYVAADDSFRIRKVSGGVITTVAGNGILGYSGDGELATSAQLGGVSRLAVDNTGSLYIADTSNFRIRKVSAVSSRPWRVTGLPAIRATEGLPLPPSSISSSRLR